MTNINRFYCYFSRVRASTCSHFANVVMRKPHRSFSPSFSFFSFSFFFYLNTEYNVYQSDVTRSGKKCWELVKLVSASCKLIYALHVPDSCPKLAARRRLSPVDKRQVLEREDGREVRSRLKGRRTIYAHLFGNIAGVHADFRR